MTMTQPSADPAPGQLDPPEQDIPPFARWASIEVDASLWDDALARCDTVRQAVAGEDLESAVDVVVRAAAFDTGAIDGLYDTSRSTTHSVAVRSAVWETELARAGMQADAYFAAQLASYRMVLDAAVRDVPVAQVWLRNLHTEIIAAQRCHQPFIDVGRKTHALGRDTYGWEPNGVGPASGSGYASTSVQDTPARVRRLAAECATAEFTAAHPVLQAAYAHYAIVVTHPFPGGNGRLARALASVYFYRAARVPFLVYADQRLDYYRALVAADGGDHSRFVGFVLDRGVEALAVLTEQLRSTHAPG